MLRKFRFEGEIYNSLNCLPMAVRRKMDRAGIKMSLLQWQQLTRPERLAICHLPADTDEETEAMRSFVNEAVIARSGSAPGELSAEKRNVAEPPVVPPARLVERARGFGFDLAQADWDGLDDDARYALVKLGDGAEPGLNLEAALTELLGDWDRDADPASERFKHRCSRPEGNA
jgi:hypothetical protein